MIFYKNGKTQNWGQYYIDGFYQVCLDCEIE